MTAARVVGAFLLAGLGCGTSASGPVTPDQIVVTPPAATLLLGDSLQLGVAVLDAGGDTIPGAAVTFRSGDTTVVRVTAAGRVRAVGVGSAFVEVRSSPATATAAFLVLAVGPPDQVRATPPAATLLVGDSLQLAVAVLDARGDTIAGAPVTFSSSDDAVAQVTATGRIRSVGAGSAYVEVRSAPASTTVPVTVLAVGSIALSPSTGVVVENGSLVLQATVYDVGGTAYPSYRPAFRSLDPAIAAVSAGGVVSFGSVGTTGIVAAAGGVADTTIVTALVARLPFADRPYGVAAHAAGTAYVLRLDAGVAHRLDLPSLAVGPAVAVGSLPASVAIDAAGTRAYVANQGSGSVAVLDVAANAVVGSLSLDGMPIFAIVVAPGDSLVYVGADNGYAYGLRATTGARVDSVFVGGPVNSLAIHDTLLYAGSPFASNVREHNLRTRTPGRSFAVGGVPQQLVVSATGQELYVANEVGSVQFWSLVTGAEVFTLALPGGGGYGMALQPGTDRLWVSTSYLGTGVHVVDAATRTLVRTVAVGGTSRRIAFTAAGWGLIGNEAGWVDLVR